MDIESANFDAKRYVLQMIKQNTIKQLICKNNEVDEEIKVHDHEIQSLVFENYSKFISSIDTVRHMKDNICEVDGRLSVLDASMGKIEALALKIDSTFSVKRREIQKLDTINKDLQKLKNLCDFPSLLKHDIAFYKTLPEGRITAEAEKLFSKSVAAYEACYSTLTELKQQPLIAPIYAESLDKVENIRSILKALQVQHKTKMHAAVLRSITKKLAIITDDQVSILRIYFHSWKERLGETCFKAGAKKISNQLTSPETTPNGRYLMMEVVGAEVPEINEELWADFVTEFSFLYRELYPKLTISAQETQLHVNNHMRDIFMWGLNNYTESAPLYCGSLKAYVHATHIITNRISEALGHMEAGLLGRQDRKEDLKIFTELSEKMQDKMETLGVNMFNFLFGRMKMYFLLEAARCKKMCLDLSFKGEENTKEVQIKVINPLKEVINGNLRIVLDEIEHLKNIYELIFKSKERYEQIIHRKVEELIAFLGEVISLSSVSLSEAINSAINPNYQQKLNKVEKELIAGVVAALKGSQQSGVWFCVAHQFLTLLNNVMGKKIIESVQKNVEVPKNHDYGRVFNLLKIFISRNLVAYANFYSNLIVDGQSFSESLNSIEEFLTVLNSIFSDAKRTIIRKPSFLTEESTFAYETEILTAKKLRLIDKKNPHERATILTYLIRKVIKQILIRMRNCTASNVYSESEVYNLIQICYELSNVEEESQICAFFYLIKSNWRGEWAKSREQMEEEYSSARREISC